MSDSRVDRHSEREVIPINKGWFFKAHNDQDGKWQSVAQFPTNVHLDLLYNGMIPDPFIGKNEIDVQWVGETCWVYRSTFFIPKASCAKSVLVFEGLDTYAIVVLNGQKILQTENMFIPERVDVSKHISHTTQNVLEIVFESTYAIGKKIVRKYPQHHWGCWNGDASRLAVRKAQYHYV